MRQRAQRPWSLVLGPLSVLLCSGPTLGNEPTARDQQPIAENERQRTRDKGQRTNRPGRRIVISIADKKLALVEDGRVRKVYPIAVGASSSPTPTGPMKIINRLTAPTYYHHGQIVPPGKSNPLGSRWLGLSKSGYGIHGTNVPGSIGKAASHGCIRMRKRDIEELFELVRVDEVVEIRTGRDTPWAKTFENAETMGRSAPAPPGPGVAKPQPSPVAVAAMSGQF